MDISGPIYDIPRTSRGPAYAFPQAGGDTTNTKQGGCRSGLVKLGASVFAKPSRLMCNLLQEDVFTDIEESKADFKKYYIYIYQVLYDLWFPDPIAFQIA